MKVTMLVVQGRPKGKCLRFAEGEYLIGRGVECHVRPNSPWVSRQHCLLQVSDGEVVVRDLCSTNGTLVNGVRILDEKRLEFGDRLQIGPLVLELTRHAPIPGALAGVNEASDPHVDNGSETRADFKAVQHLR
jgi:pSer/pThr/pTyr-binding forkhead associated (FHA) protein